MVPRPAAATTKIAGDERSHGQALTTGRYVALGASRPSIRGHLGHPMCGGLDLGAFCASDQGAGHTHWRALPVHMPAAVFAA